MIFVENLDTAGKSFQIYAKEKYFEIVLMFLVMEVSTK